jgi:hypothetical protein
MLAIPDVAKYASHFTRPTVALGTLGVAAGGSYVATSTIAGVGDWSHPTVYGDATAVAGGLTAVVGVAGLLSGGKGAMALAHSSAKSAARQAMTGMAFAKVVVGAGVLAGGSMGIVKSHERMEKPYVDIHVKSEIVSTFDAAKSVGDTVDSATKAGGDLIGNIGNALNSLNPWAK